MMYFLDGFSSYNDIKVKCKENFKTTFTTRWHTFTYYNMLFGLINGGATFYRVMHIEFDDLICDIV